MKQLGPGVGFSKDQEQEQYSSMLDTGRQNQVGLEILYHQININDTGDQFMTRSNLRLL
jgi:hypothetical protein